MKIYLLSLGAGVLVGIIYGLLNVRSPAPPVVALIGLLGILVGEQVVPLARSIWKNEPAAAAWLNQIEPHVFGHLPGARQDRVATLSPKAAASDASLLKPSESTSSDHPVP